MQLTPVSVHCPRDYGSLYIVYVYRLSADTFVCNGCDHTNGLPVCNGCMLHIQKWFNAHPDQRPPVPFFAP